RTPSNTQPAGRATCPARTPPSPSTANVLIVGGHRSHLRCYLFGADDHEVGADEDVMRPVDADYVDVVLAVAQQHDTVDGASRVGCHRSGLGLIRRCTGDD